MMMERASEEDSYSTCQPEASRSLCNSSTERHIKIYCVKCSDLIGNAGGQYMFFLLLFYWLRLSKVSQRGSNKSYLIKRLRQI